MIISVRVLKQLGVHPATISREVRRNSSQAIYKAVSAAKQSDARRAGARKHCKPVTWFSHHLPLWLKHGMSPEQIAQRLKQEQPDRAVNQVIARSNLRPRKRLDWKTPYEVYLGVSVALMC